jgi:hypothetical protein
MDSVKELNEKIIKTQEEMIEILKESVQNRDKYIVLLEKQLAIIGKYLDNEQQQK